MKDLKPYQIKELLNSILIDGQPIEQTAAAYGVEAQDIARYIDANFGKAYRAAHMPPKQDLDRAAHRQAVFKAIAMSLGLASLAFIALFVFQGFYSGYNWTVFSQTGTFLSKPFAAIVGTLLGAVCVVGLLYSYFPIVPVFLNEKVNTVSLKDSFLKATPGEQLKFTSNIIMALCLFVALMFLSFAGKAQDTDNKALCVLKTAAAERGKVEGTANNRAAFIDNYRTTVVGRKVSGWGDPWCAYFVAHCYKICAALTPNYAPRAANWFGRGKIVYCRDFAYGIIPPDIKPGDLVGYRFNAGNIGHIGIVQHWNWQTGKFRAYEGNTSPKQSVYRDAGDKDGVYLKERKISQAYMVARWI